MKTETLLAGLEKTYEEAKKKECEELHSALVTVITDQHATIQNILMVLELIKFQLLEAKYKEIMGTVKLTDIPPLAIKKKGE